MSSEQTTITVTLNTRSRATIDKAKDRINHAFMKWSIPGLQWDIAEQPDNVESELEEIMQSIETLADDLRGTGAEPILMKIHEQLGKALDTLEESD